MRNLPTSTRLSVNKISKGFTLVELLVVITIMVILATIGVTVFSSAQGNARDGKRVAEVNAIAKSIETSKDMTVTVPYYKYNATQFSNDFPRGVPTDPNSALSYCVSINIASTVPPANATTNASSGCPTGGPGALASATVSGYLPMATATDVRGNAIITSTDPADPSTAGANIDLVDPVSGTYTGVKSFTVCASRERNSTPYCVSSLTK